MAGLNFSDITNKKLEEVERPPLAPVGTYRWQVTKLPTITTSSDGKWDIVNFPIRALEALDDTDMSDYAGEVTSITESVRFMFNKEDEVEFKKSEYRLRNFLEKALKCADETSTLGVAMNASVNQQFIAPLTWRPDKNDTSIFYTQLGTAAPLE